MKPRRLSVPAAATVAAIAGCSGDVPGRAGVTSRDSAGVTIVWNESPALRPPDAWTLADTPDVVIGGESDSTQQLYRVRGAARLESGALAIANAGTFQVQVYDSGGARVRTFGREGSGPGEFSSLDAIWPLPADSILAWDGGRRQIHVFDGSGRYLRSIRFSSSLADRPRRFPNGEFMGLTGVHDTLPRSTNEVWWESWTFLRFTSEGDSLGHIGPLRGMEYMATEWQGSPLRAQRPLGRAASMAVGDGVFYYGDSDEYRILAFEPGGALTRIIERSAAPRPITSEVRAAYIRERLGAAPDPQLRAAWDQYFANVPFPEDLPAYRQLEVDREGNLWVQAWDPPGSPEISWSVFSPAGRWITEVRGPRGQILEIGRDYLILLLRDELGVERVAVMRIIKPGTSAP
jgi:hypothetical protein